MSMRRDRGYRAEMKCMRRLDARLCDMHDEGSCHKVNMRWTAIRLCESLDLLRVA